MHRLFTMYGQQIQGGVWRNDSLFRNVRQGNDAAPVRARLGLLIVHCKRSVHWILSPMRKAVFDGDSP